MYGPSSALEFLLLHALVGQTSHDHNVCILQLRIFVLTLVFFIVQLLAMVWYALSYIPYARELATRMFSGFVGE